MGQALTVVNTSWAFARVRLSIPSACRNLLDDLEQRGLPEIEILLVVDGGSGLNKALNEKYQLNDPKKSRAYRVRCYVRKWRNISDVLTAKQSEECAAALERMLGKFNASAFASFLKANRIESLN